MSFQNLTLQLERLVWRATLAGCQVTVQQHLDGTLSLTHGPSTHRERLWRRQPSGRKGPWKKPRGRKGRKWKIQKDNFPTRFKCAGFHPSHRPGDSWLGSGTGHVMDYKNRTF